MNNFAVTVSVMTFIACFGMIQLSGIRRLKDPNYPVEDGLCVSSFNVSRKYLQLVYLLVGQSLLMENCMQVTCDTEDIDEDTKGLIIRMNEVGGNAVYDKKFCWVTNENLTGFPNCRKPIIECKDGYRGDYGVDI